MRAEIISIGTELLLGEITDSDAAYLASQLPLLGIDLYWISQVGDNKSRLIEVLRRAWQRSELILTTGGLGPTEDDLTREAIAEMLGEPLVAEPSLENGLRERFARLGMAMPLSNLKQATVIPSAQPITNARGTAPGWWVARDGRVMVVLPGPPLEMQEMWQQQVQPRLREQSSTIILSRTLKTLGLAEAAVGELVSPWLAAANPTLGIYARADGIHLRLAAKAESRQKAEKMVAGVEAEISAILGEHIWGADDDTLEGILGRRLVDKGLSLAVMEDYSGGLFAASIADSPESPRFFQGGLIVTADEARAAFGVSAETVAQYGVVSPEVAQSMAAAVRALLKADIGVAIVGREETAGVTGIVYMAVADGKSHEVRPLTNRIGGKRRAVSTVLFELNKLLGASGRYR